MHKRAKTVLVLCIALLSSAVAGQQTNPKKLPPCPKPDQSKKTDKERFSKWTGCWGKYEVKDFGKAMVYESEWRNGMPTGEGKMVLPEGIGEYFGNIFGTGTLTLFNGDTYVGPSLGVLEAFFTQMESSFNDVTYTSKNGEKYIGKWRNGKKNGYGMYTFSSGDKYVGEWNNDKKQGQGTYIFASGDKYVGEWKDDKRHGLGSFITADGQRFTGIWEDGYFKGDAPIKSPTPRINDLEVPAVEENDPKVPNYPEKK